MAWVCRTKRLEEADRKAAEELERKSKAARDHAAKRKYARLKRLLVSNSSATREVSQSAGA